MVPPIETAVPSPRPTLRGRRPRTDPWGVQIRVLRNIRQAEAGAIGLHHNLGRQHRELVGPGILNAAQLTLSNSAVSGNQNRGIYNTRSLTVTGSTVSGNAVSGADPRGAGVFDLGTLTVTGSTISQNTGADQGGGIYHAGDGILTLGSRTSVTGNSAGRGGGVYNTSLMTLDGATISNNASPPVGGVALTNGGNLSVRSGAIVDINANQVVGVP